MTTEVGSTAAGTAGYVHKFDALGAHYFVCGKSDHCTRGQKMVVNVFPAPAATPSGAGANSYSNTPPSSGASSFAATLMSTLVAAAVLAYA
jgi:hypothetical protein